MTIGKRFASTGLMGLLLLSAGCGGPGASPRISAGPPSAPAPSSPAAAVPPTGSSPTASAAVVGPAPGDLHEVDWASTPFPGEYCDVPGLVRSSDSDQVKEHSRTWGAVHVFRYAEVTYGDLDGDGRDEAAISVSCDNGGGTASGQLVFGYVVFGRSAAGLVALGSLTARQRPSGVATTRMGGVVLGPGRATVTEHWYHPEDPTCCPQGRATTVWTYENQRFVPTSPRITS
ncbi:hypothetical protein [Streptomyces sp. WAC06614]|uniref:hypothetical protein n=1 Tax=Streptomyces sp. WAC06614 TaxID=2487416 RepID=UPI000F7B9879|nr:hypothetical protein [Streptomyces sp. WAC06614]RSS84366.1 hypothetical protein EF918_00465 [Streptomyces sp. WAC06614]